MIDLNKLNVGIFLATRQIKRGSLWTTVMIIFIMVLTFLNLVAVNGFLVGLIEGAIEAVQARYYGDVFVSPASGDKYIEQSQKIINIIESLPEVKAYSARYIEGGTIEANYKTKVSENDNKDEVTTSIAGINPENENIVAGLESTLLKGEYLEPDDFDKVVLGQMLLREYLNLDSPNFPVLEDVEVGDKIKVTIGDSVREMTVKGIIGTKTDEVDRRVFINDKQLRELMGRDNLNVDEIAIVLNQRTDDVLVRDILKESGAENWARVQTFDEGMPKFILDMKKTFGLLGTIFGSTGIVVSAITVFIVIFINAITRRKFIGILKGIGISGSAIEIAYVIQSLFYAFIGSIIGLLVLYILMVPYFNANPINFPFSDGILVAPFGETMLRVLLLIVSTMIAGYVPARIIVRRNTLDAILGR